MVRHGMPPYIEEVNSLDEGQRAIAPPAEGWDEPMHWDPFARVANGAWPILLKYDGTKHKGYRQAMRQAQIMDAMEARMI